MKKKIKLVKEFERVLENNINVYNDKEFLKEFNKVYDIVVNVCSTYEELNYLIDKIVKDALYKNKKINFKCLSRILELLRMYNYKNNKELRNIIDFFGLIVENVDSFDNECKIVEVVENVFINDFHLKEFFKKANNDLIDSIVLLKDSKFIKYAVDCSNMSCFSNKSHSKIESFINGDFCCSSINKSWFFTLIENVLYEKNFKKPIRIKKILI